MRLLILSSQITISPDVRINGLVESSPELVEGHNQFVLHGERQLGPRVLLLLNHLERAIDADEHEPQQHTRDDGGEAELDDDARRDIDPSLTGNDDLRLWLLRTIHRHVVDVVVVVTVVVVLVV